MASRTTTPIWRTHLALKIMFWTGVALAPLAAITLMLGDTGTTIKFALIMGMGSIVLIGLSVTWRKDATSVERELVTAMSDVEADAHRMVAELRAEMRQIGRGGEARPVGGAEESRPRPRPEVIDEDRGRGRRGAGSRPAYESTVDYDELGSTGPLEAQERPDYHGEDRYRDSREYTRRTETVSVRHETTSNHEPDGRRRRAPEPEGYGRGGQSFGRHGRDGSFDPQAEADSLLSGLQDDGGYGETMRVPRQRGGRHDDHRRSGEYPRASDSGEYPRASDSGEYPRASDSGEFARPRGDGSRRGAWRTEERSAELRMGKRESRSVPEDGWQDSRPGRAASWSMESDGRRGRHSSPDEPQRAISAQEDEPMPRWTDYESGGSSRASSYMDQYYGDNRR